MPPDVTQTRRTAAAAAAAAAAQQQQQQHYPYPHHHPHPHHPHPQQPQPQHQQQQQQQQLQQQQLLLLQQQPAPPSLKRHNSSTICTSAEMPALIPLNNLDQSAHSVPQTPLYSSGLESDPLYSVPNAHFNLKAVMEASCQAAEEDSDCYVGGGSQCYMRGGGSSCSAVGENHNHNHSNVHEDSSPDRREACSSSSANKPSNVRATPPCSSSSASPLYPAEQSGYMEIKRLMPPVSSMMFGASDMDENRSAMYAPLPSNVDTETYTWATFDATGGRLFLPESGVMVTVPEGTLPAGQVQEMYMAVCRDAKDRPPLSDQQTLVSPVIHIGPPSVRLVKPIILSFHHCASMRHGSWILSLYHSDGPLDQPARWRRLVILGQERLHSQVYTHLDPNHCHVMTEYLNRYALIGESVPGGQAVKIYRLAAFSPALPPTMDYSIRVYVVEDTQDALDGVVQVEQRLGGSLVDRPKQLAFQDGGHNLCLTLEDLSSGWRSKLPASYQTKHSVFIPRGWNEKGVCAGNGRGAVASSLQLEEYGSTTAGKAAVLLITNHDAIVNSTVLITNHDAIVNSTVLITNHDAIVNSTVLITSHDAIVNSTVLITNHDAIVNSTVLITNHGAIVNSTVLITNHDAIVNSTVLITNHGAIVNSTVLITNHDAIVNSTVLITSHDAIVNSTVLITNHDAIVNSTVLITNHDAIVNSTVLITSHDAIVNSTVLITNHDAIVNSTVLITNHDAIVNSTVLLTNHDAIVNSTVLITNHDAIVNSTVLITNHYAIVAGSKLYSANN
ncbi:hypothetical protein ACOMHN_017518 [Nucella lapillus]